MKMRTNCHTHTARCGHAYGSDEEYVQAAIAAGIRVLGFSDHIPWPDKVQYLRKQWDIPQIPTLHMSWDQAEEYAASVRLLEKKYEGQIQIYLGFEAEYLSPFFRKQKNLFFRCGMDYMILGQHFVPVGERYVYAGQETKDEKVLALYVDAVMRGLSTGMFRYLCHPDLIHYTGDTAIYRKHMRRLCTEAKRLSCPLEINLLGLGDGRHYPNETFWEIAGETGNDVILGVDAHHPSQLRDTGIWERGSMLAEKYHLSLLDGIF